MIKKNIQAAINGQINAELYSAYLYLSMAAYFQSISLKGAANWMRVQSQEELVHAMKLYDYLSGIGGRITLSAIDAPPTSWDSPQDVFNAVYIHEQKVTGLINSLVGLARSEDDYETGSMLQWFVDEQVEEEASAGEVLRKVKSAGDSPGAMSIIDGELGTRVFTPPT